MGQLGMNESVRACAAAEEVAVCVEVEMVVQQHPPGEPVHTEHTAAYTFVYSLNSLARFAPNGLCLVSLPRAGSSPLRDRVPVSWIGVRMREAVNAVSSIVERAGTSTARCSAVAVAVGESGR